MYQRSYCKSLKAKVQNTPMILSGVVCRKIPVPAGEQEDASHGAPSLKVPLKKLLAGSAY